MTEDEWLSCSEPADLLTYLRDRASERKLRLFACACCQRVWPWLTRSAVQEAIRIAERHADGLATREELRAGWASVRKSLSVAPLSTRWEDSLMAALNATTETMNFGVALQTAESASRALDTDWRERTRPENTDEDRLRRERGMPEERAHQSRLVRDLFPFVPVNLDPAWQRWQHGQAVALADTIYEEERFQDLPVLADALEEAGCADDAILRHCRQRGVHVRGCWVLDLLLGKT